MASLFKRKNSKYWWVKWYENGVAQSKSTKCIRKFDAEIVLKTKYIPREVNTFNKSNIMSVKRPLKECLVEYRDSVLIHSHDGIKQKSIGTINRQQTNVNNFLIYLEQKTFTDFEEITEEIIRDYIQAHLIKICQKKPNTVYKDVQIVQNFFKWAVKNHYCSENPTADIKNTKPPPSVPRYFSNEQVESIFANAKEPYLSIFKLLYLTGLRIQELLNVEWSDIDLNQKLIIIRVREGNKPRRETLVHLNISAMEILRQMESVKANNKYLFTNQLGNQYAQGKVSSYSVRLYEKLNISTEDPLHSWRHTCASHLVIKGVSLYIVKEILRHKSIKETEIYAHLSRESVQKAVESLTV